MGIINVIGKIASTLLNDFADEATEKYYKECKKLDNDKLFEMLDSGKLNSRQTGAIESVLSERGAL